MSTAQHAPAPWYPAALYVRTHRVYDRSATESYATTPAIAKIAEHEFMSPQEVAANVRLIAAAPDLLAALKDMADCYPDSDSFVALVKARAAIAKATGDAQ